jgi:heme-degrading monooxygenase HmoA
MFAVIFEVHPRPEQLDSYFDHAKVLRPELEQVDGFIDNVRYRSLTRPGWLLSLSSWRDEKAVVRWRTTMRHHIAQERGRAEILLDYHLRVGEITEDTRIPTGHALREQRLDQTEVGEASTVMFIDAKRPDAGDGAFSAADASAHLGFDASAEGLVGSDVFDAVLTPGDLILLTSWRTDTDAEAFRKTARKPADARARQVRIVRDYGMFDRREAPQYYPAVEPQDARA